VAALFLDDDDVAGRDERFERVLHVVAVAASDAVGDVRDRLCETVIGIARIGMRGDKHKDRHAALICQFLSFRDWLLAEFGAHRGSPATVLDPSISFSFLAVPPTAGVRAPTGSLR